MKFPVKQWTEMFNQFVSSILCICLLVNLALPVAAQARPGKKPVSMRRLSSEEMQKYLEKAYEDSLAKTFVSESTNTMTPAKAQYFKQQENYFNDPVVRRLMKIRQIFVPVLPEQTKTEKNDEEQFHQQFLKAYNQEVLQQVRQAQTQLEQAAQKQREYIQDQVAQARQADVSEGVITNWVNIENAKIEEMLSAAKAKIAAWQMQAKKQAPQHYQAALKQAREESHRRIRTEVKELMSLYRKHPKKATPFVLEVSLAILMAEGAKTPLFTKEEKKELHDLYLKTVRTAPSAKDAQSEEAFGPVLSAVSGLGLIGGGFDDSAAIGQFISNHLQTPLAPSVLLTGVSSLLAMQAYGTVRGILDQATRNEENTGVIFSFTELTQALININGQYLGEVSKWAQFPVPQKGQVKALGQAPSGNAWEEVAYMLAADGSEKALELLRDYGINKCAAYPKMSFKNEWEFGCSGMKPFLVGALLSGKAGTYTGNTNAPLHAGYVMDRNGTRYVNEEQAQSNRYRQAQAVKNVNDFVAKLGLTLPTAIVRQFYLRNMGDLDADTQLLLDQKLYAFFDKKTNGQKALPQNMRLRPYDKNSAQYKSKQRQQHRAKTWLTVATLADIAFIIWCSYDLVRLGVKAVNLGRTVYMTTRMARAGAPVASRVAVMYRLKTARSLVWFRQAKEGAAFAVRVQARQFANAGQWLKVPGATASKSLLEVALPTAAFSAKDGQLLLNKPVIVEQMKVQAVQLGQAAPLPASAGKRAVATGVTEAVGDVQLALDKATQYANARFAARNKWWHKLTPNQNAVYRRYLADEVSRQSLRFYRKGDRGLLVDFSKQIAADRSIVVPQKIKEMKSLPLFDKQGTLNPAAVRNVLGVLANGTTSQSRLEIRQALALAQQNAAREFANRSGLARWTGALFGKNKTVYNNLLANHIVRLLEDDTVLTSVSPLQKEKILGLLATAVRNNRNISVPADIGSYVGLQQESVKYPHKYKEMSSLLLGSQTEAHPALPVNFRVERGVSGVTADGSYQRVVFTPSKDGYFMGLFNGMDKPSNLANFKINVPEYNMPAIIRAAADAGLETALEFKLTPYAGAKAFRKAMALSGESAQAAGKVKYNPLGNALSTLRNKQKIWVHEVPVFMRAAEGTELATPVKIMADKRLGLEGARFVLNGDNKLELLQGGKLINDKLFYFSLPKKQIAPFVGLVSNGKWTSPLTLTVKSGNNKLLPLYLSTGLSLSSASVGLIAPLETTYSNRVTDTDKTLISLAFPYLPSLMAPALSPFVMRFGALRVVQFALLSVAAGLAFTWGMGFNGNLDQNNLPPIWPLFVSGTAIGISSALSRSGLNVLIDTLGGGGGLLKSMAFKNLGSLFLLAPSFAYGGYKLAIEPKLKKQPLSEEELAKPATDFSLAFPVLTGLTTGILTYLSLARISPAIGRSESVINAAKIEDPAKQFHFGRAMLDSWKTITYREVLPLATSAFFFTGFEAAAFSKASNQALRPRYEDMDFVKNSVPGNRKNLVSLLTGGTVALMPFITRMAAKPTLRALSDPLKPGAEYKRMLGLSYAMNAAGGVMLMKYGMDENPQVSDMLLGIGLMGFGTANVTQSLQKLANLRVSSKAVGLRLFPQMAEVERAAKLKDLRTMTMTGFSWSQIGLAAVPLLQSRYVDTEVAQGVTSSSKGPLSSIWIPLGSLGLSLAFASRSIGLNFALPAGLLGGTKLLLDGPASFNPWPYGQAAAYQFNQNRYGKFQSGIQSYQKHQAEKAKVPALGQSNGAFMAQPNAFAVPGWTLPALKLAPVPQLPAPLPKKP